MIRKLLYLCTDNTDPYHNLALEQYLTDTVPADICILYLWQNRHTVVIGRNQNAWQECRTALLEQDGGKLSRRLSGGGAVYHDMGNLNFTFSLPTAEYDLHRQQRVIVEACRSLGIEASFSGRNDILAAGRKFSGNSFYHHNGCSFHNGTLLVSVDMANLGKYLTPSQRKLQSKGVASVPSRVVNLSELHPGLRISQMQQAMAQAFADVYGLPVTTITESQLDASEIEARRMRFASYDWIYGRAQPFPFSCGARYPWGEITLELQVEEGVCRDAAVYTDSMDAEFAAPLAEALPVNVGAEHLVGGQNRPPEVLAQQRIGNRLHAHAALAIVQRQTVATVVVGAQPPDQPVAAYPLGGRQALDLIQPSSPLSPSHS